MTEHASVQPGGATRVGVLLDIEGGWHIYGSITGDVGLPTQIAWSVAPGAAMGPIQWPPTEEFQDPGSLHTSGYAGRAIPYSRLTVAPNAQIGRPVLIHATVKWLACKELCVPGSADLELVLPVSATPPVGSAHAQFFDQVQP